VYSGETDLANSPFFERGHTRETHIVNITSHRFAAGECDGVFLSRHRQAIFVFEKDFDPV
jgi:hypothetical protein